MWLGESGFPIHMSIYDTLTSLTLGYNALSITSAILRVDGSVSAPDAPPDHCCCIAEVQTRVMLKPILWAARYSAMQHSNPRMPSGVSGF